MNPLGELLATDHRRTLEFFVSGLQDVSEPDVDRQELFYNASVLAHYAQVSTKAGIDWPAPKNLSDVFDHFVSDTTLRHDSLTMEVAGTQCLLLAGFFEDQRIRCASGTTSAGTRSWARVSSATRPSTNGLRAKRGCWTRLPVASNRGVNGTHGWPAHLGISGIC